MTTIEGRTGLKFQLIAVEPQITIIKLALDGVDAAITVMESVPRIMERFYGWIHEGQYIQDAFASWTPFQREFLLTGYTEKEWNELFGEE